MFLQQAEELTMDEVDEVIEMSLDDTPEQALRRAVDGCVRILGLEMPSEEKIKEALDVAAQYKVKIRNNETKHDKGKTKAPRYFGILPEISLSKLLREQLARDRAPESAVKFFEQLQADNRLTARPHITVVHSNNKDTEKDLWEACMSMQTLEQPPVFSFRLSNLLWNDRVMAITVDNLAVAGDQPGDEVAGAKFLLQLTEVVKDRFHITVGTRRENVPAVEAKALAEDFKAQRLGALEVFPLEGDVFTQGRLKGLMS